MPGSSFKGAARPAGAGPVAPAFGRRPRGFSTSTPTPNWTMYGGAPGEFRKPGDRRKSTGQNWTMYGGARGEYREPDWRRYGRGGKSQDNPAMPDRDLQMQWQPARFGRQP